MYVLIPWLADKTLANIVDTHYIEYVDRFSMSFLEPYN